MLNMWRRTQGMISEDPTLRRRQKIALSAVGLSIPIALFSGFVGTAVIAGDPPHEGTWSAISVVGIAAAVALVVGGNLVWQVARMRDARTPRDPS